MIGNSINLNVSGNTKPKELKQNRKTRMRYYMPEGGEITFDFFFFDTRVKTCYSKTIITQVCVVLWKEQKRVKHLVWHAKRNSITWQDILYIFMEWMMPACCMLSRDQYLRCNNDVDDEIKFTKPNHRGKLIHVREHRISNQEWTIQRYWSFWTHNTQEKKQQGKLKWWLREKPWINSCAR